MTPHKKDVEASKPNIIAALEDGATIPRAAKAGGISEATLHRWRAADEVFRAEVQRARKVGQGMRLAVAEDTLLANAKKGDTTASIFLCKSLDRATYGDKLAHGGDPDNPVVHEVTVTIVDPKH